MSSRRLFTIAVAAVAALSLSGCSAVVSGVVGISVENDRVIALVAMCPDYSSNTVTISPWGRSSGGETKNWAFEDSDRASVDLGTISELQALLGDKTMMVSSNSSGFPGAVGGFVLLESSQLDRLATGTILVGTESPENAEEVDSQGFDQAYDDWCAKF